MLSSHGFKEIQQPDSWLHNFVLRAPSGDTIDVHSYTLHPDGRNSAGVPYIADQLGGTGVILGTPVRCVPPNWLVRFHTGYEVDEDDWHDVQLLCARFGLPVPEVYARFVKKDSQR